MKKTFLFLGVALLMLASCKNNESKTSNVSTEMKTKQDSVSYSLGVVIANSLKKDNYYGDLNYPIFMKAFKEFIDGKAKIDPKQAEDFLRKFNADKTLKEMKKSKADNEKFMSDNSKKEGVITENNGLQYEIIKKGNGASPDTNDIVYVQYKGMLIDGTVFDSSKADQGPVKFNMKGLIPGMKMALLKMKEGGEWKIYIPYQLAYGEQGIPNTPIKPYSTLIFDIKLEKVEKQ